MIDPVRELRKLKSQKVRIIKPEKIMTIKGPYRTIDIYDLQPTNNQVKIIKIFMEAESVREELRSRV